MKICVVSKQNFSLQTVRSPRLVRRKLLAVLFQIHGDELSFGGRSDAVCFVTF